MRSERKRISERQERQRVQVYKVLNYCRTLKYKSKSRTTGTNKRAKRKREKLIFIKRSERSFAHKYNYGHTEEANKVYTITDNDNKSNNNIDGATKYDEIVHDGNQGQTEERERDSE